MAAEIDETVTIRPGALRAQKGRGGAVAGKGPGELDGDHRVPVLVGHLVREAVPRDPGIGHEDVQPAQVVPHPADHRGDLLAIGHVAAIREHPLTGAGRDLGRCAICHVAVAIDQRDVQPVLREPQRDGGADTTRRACDQRA